MDLGALSRPAATAAPMSDEDLEKQLSRAGQPHLPVEPAGLSLPPPLINPGARYEVVDEDSVEDLTPEQIEAELAALAEKERVNALRAKLAAERAKAREMAEARAAIPANDPVRDASTTWLLMPEAGPEAALCEEWVAEHCPVKIVQNAIVQMLDLAQLRPDDSVICMVRGKDKRRPLTRMQITVVQGENISSERPTDELLAQMVLTQPVFCRDHWVMTGASGMGRAGGRLNYATFLEAIGKVCTPLAPRRADSNSCKEGTEARMLVLRDL